MATTAGEAFDKAAEALDEAKGQSDADTQALTLERAEGWRRLGEAVSVANHRN